MKSKKIYLSTLFATLPLLTLACKPQGDLRHSELTKPSSNSHNLPTPGEGGGGSDRPNPPPPQPTPGEGGGGSDKPNPPPPQPTPGEGGGGSDKPNPPPPPSPLYYTSEEDNDIIEFNANTDTNQVKNFSPENVFTQCKTTSIIPTGFKLSDNCTISLTAYNDILKQSYNVDLFTLSSYEINITAIDTYNNQVNHKVTLNLNTNLAPLKNANYAADIFNNYSNGGKQYLPSDDNISGDTNDSIKGGHTGWGMIVANLAIQQDPSQTSNQFFQKQKAVVTISTAQAWWAGGWSSVAVQFNTCPTPDSDKKNTQYPTVMWDPTNLSQEIFQITLCRNNSPIQSTSNYNNWNVWGLDVNNGSHAFITIKAVVNSDSNSANKGQITTVSEVDPHAPTVKVNNSPQNGLHYWPQDTSFKLTTNGQFPFTFENDEMMWNCNGDDKKQCFDQYVN